MKKTKQPHPSAWEEEFTTLKHISSAYCFKLVIFWVIASHTKGLWKPSKSCLLEERHICKGNLPLSPEEEADQLSRHSRLIGMETPSLLVAPRVSCLPAMQLDWSHGEGSGINVYHDHSVSLLFLVTCPDAPTISISAFGWGWYLRWGLRSFRWVTFSWCLPCIHVI